jgi:hypothetical protein
MNSERADKNRMRGTTANEYDEVKPASSSDNNTSGRKLQQAKLK